MSCLNADLITVFRPRSCWKAIQLKQGMYDFIASEPLSDFQKFRDRQRLNIGISAR